jgi:hypothetical protein
LKVTGQSFEESQEQNTRLLAQLHEKEDSTLKLMAANLRTTQQVAQLEEAQRQLQAKVFSFSGASGFFVLTANV